MTSYYFHDTSTQPMTKIHDIIRLRCLKFSFRIMLRNLTQQRIETRRDGSMGQISSVCTENQINVYEYENELKVKSMKS